MDITATMASALLRLSLSLRPKPILSSTTTAPMDIMATMASAPLMLSPRLLPLPTEADMATVDTEVAEADMATMASALLRLSLWQKLKLILSFTTTALMDIMATMASAPLMLSLRLLPLPTEADMATVDTEVAEADMATMASALLRPSLRPK